MSVSPSLIEQQSFYDDRWEQGSAYGFGTDTALRISWLCDSLSQKRLELGRPLRILDFGCGQGRYAALATQFGKVDAIDLSETGIEVAARCHPGPAYQCMNVFDFECDEPYDAILSIEVLEHIEDQQKYIQRVNKLLVDGGSFVLTMPNKQASACYWSDQKHLKTAQPIENWLTLYELQSLLKSNGFNCRRLETGYVGYRRTGLGRIVNSYKLNRMSAGTPRRIAERLGFGLYLFADAVKVNG